MSSFFRLNLKDVAKGLVVAVLIAVLQLSLTLLQSSGFDAFSVANLTEVLELALTGGAAYLLKNLFSDSDGKVLGSIG